LLNVTGVFDAAQATPLAAQTTSVKIDKALTIPPPELYRQGTRIIPEDIGRHKGARTAPIPSRPGIHSGPVSRPGLTVTVKKA